MAAIVNARDTLLQAAAPRIGSVPLVGSTLDFANVTGGTKPDPNADVTTIEIGAGIVISAGGFTLNGTGSMKGGQTSYNNGFGFFMGFENGVPKFSLGNGPSGNRLTWDTSTGLLTLAGNLDFGYILNGPPANADNTVTRLNAGVSTSGQITLTQNGHIKAGQSWFNTGSGFFLGWDTTHYKLSIGDQFGQRMTWNGSTLEINGNIVGGRIRIGNGDTSNNAAFEVDQIYGITEAMQISSGPINVTNQGWATVGAITASSWANAPAVVGNVSASNANGNAHGVRGQHFLTGASGLIGGSNGFDFYADGTGTNYGPFTGTHEGLSPNDKPPLVPGSLVVDLRLVERNGWSGTIFEVAPSSYAYQQGVLGVVCAEPKPLSEARPSAFIAHWKRVLKHSPYKAPSKLQKDEGTTEAVMKPSYERMKDSYQVAAVNALGEGQLLVCGEGGNIEIGDLIVASSTPGKGMKQNDNVVRGYTVARAREAVKFYNEGQISLLACIYKCG